MTPKTQLATLAKSRSHSMDPHTVNLQQVKTQSSRLLDLAHVGEEIIVEKAGKPYARLMPD